LNSESKINLIVSQKNNKKNLVILSIVGLFAFHGLYFLTFFRINFPYSVDYYLIDYLYSYLVTGVFPLEYLFSAISGHFVIFPRLVILPNLLLNSFDVINILYFQWGISCLSLVFIFLILRKTDSRLYWLLVPISAFLFSPLTGSNYWAVIMLMWLIPQLAIIVIIYFLNKTKLNFKSILGVILAAIIATFSSTIGIVAWLLAIVGVIHINKEEKKLIEKKWLIIMILSAIVTGLIFYSFVPKNTIDIHPLQLLTFDGFSFITTYLSSPFRLKYDFLKIGVGTVSILLSVYGAYYFVIQKKKVKTALPWLLFLLVGITAAVVTALGRMHLEGHYGDEPYYITISQFFQIGLMGLLGLMILDIKNSSPNRRKKIILIFFYIVIASQMVLLIPSYYIAWSRSDYYYQEKSQYVSCFSLSHGKYCLDNQVFNSQQHIELINYQLENRLSIFKEEEFNQQNVEDLQKFEQIWYDETKTNVGFGEIEAINDVAVLNEESMIIEGPIIVMTGWALDHEKKQMDSIYLLVDNKPFLKYDDFQPRPDIINSLETTSSELNPGWTISLLSGYIEDGCHDFIIAGLHGEDKIMFEQKIQVCKNNS